MEEEAEVAFALQEQVAKTNDHKSQISVEATYFSLPGKPSPAVAGNATLLLGKYIETYFLL